ncbi:hypothetical protein BKN14_04395 [Candidatus Gracilibacteria bacterium HOT-871]|nr:hypothetical protein BKN14_04395 [Candidatus Gracilibacteria bacterium HOT-871]
MKRIILILSILFFLFSCFQKQDEKINQNKSNSGKIVENQTGKVEEKKENLIGEKKAKECLEKSPIKREEYLNFVYFAFKNKNDNKCYYLGFFNNQFFLVDENLEKNIKNNLEKDLKDGYFIKNKNDTDEEVLRRIIFHFSINKYNLLYGERISSLQKYIFKKYGFHEAPVLAVFDGKNILDLYLEKFKELNIVLPEKYETLKNNFLNKEVLKSLEYRSEETKKSGKDYIPVKKYFYDLDFENLYNILREKQQKELEK